MHLLMFYKFSFIIINYFKIVIEGWHNNKKLDEKGKDDVQAWDRILCIIELNVKKKKKFF